MKDSARRPGDYLIALLLTVVLHFVLFMMAGYIQIRSPFATAPEPKSKYDRVTVKQVELDELMKQHPMKPPEARERLISEHESKLHKLFERQELIQPPEHRLKPVVSGLGKNVLEQVTLSKTQAPEPPTSPRPEILEIPMRELSAAQVTPSTLRIPQLKRHKLQGHLIPSITSDTPGGGGFSAEDVGLGLRMGLPDRTRSGFSPTERTRVTPLPPVPTVVSSVPKTVLKEDDAGILDDMLNVSLSVYRDPETGEGYYRIDAAPKPNSDRLGTIPHDILFLLDASASITKSKLEEFRNGLDMALDGLSSDTRFNVVAFRKESMPLFQDYQPVTGANLARARQFIDKLNAKGKTDVYAGLIPHIVAKRPAARPLLVLLVSDGVTTTSELDNRNFLNQISKNNNASASIFCFSAGLNTNSFLMNFAAYNNGGQSWYHARESTADRALNDIAGGLSEILVRDPTCTVSGELEEELYPKRLPHLFRGHGLTVFGKFGAADEEVEIRVVGRDHTNRLQELIVNRSFAQATPVGPELMQIWAGQKAAHLVSEDIKAPSEERRREIDAISQRYGIVVNYQ